MGCAQSSDNHADVAAKQRSDEIEKELRRAKMEQRQDIKLLFLGAGESELGERCMCMPLGQHCLIEYGESLTASMCLRLPPRLDAGGSE